MTLQIRQLEAFRAVLETGSVTRAGERLHISQPAVTKLVRNLERACGYPLFDRRGGRLIPTREAELLAGEVERVFTGAERISQVAAAIGSRHWGEISLAAFPAMGLRFLPEVLSRFLAARKDVRATLVTRSSRQTIETVAAQQVDLGLSLLPVEHPFVTARHLASFASVCVLPRDHPLAGRTVIRAEDLRGESFISLGQEDRSRHMIDGAFQDPAIAREIRIETHLSEAACAFVANGMGVSLVDPFTASSFGDPRLISRPFHPRVTFEIWMLTPTARPAPALLGDFTDALAEALAAFAGAESAATAGD